MNNLEIQKSYRFCKQVTLNSGSNFCKAFSLLPPSQRQAMEAVYAYARIADDQSDSFLQTDAPSASLHKHLNDTSPRALVGSTDDKEIEATATTGWNKDLWKKWISDLVSTDYQVDGGVEATDERVVQIDVLEPLRPALQHTVRKFQIPAQVFNDLIDGIDFDQSASVEVYDWPMLRRYCEQVASSVGKACVAIWSARGSPIPASDLPSTFRMDPTNTPSDLGLPVEQLQLANACGIAFQLTNILRDLPEDAMRGRCYLPAQDLKRFNLTMRTWLSSMAEIQAGQEIDQQTRLAIEELMLVYIERARGFYEVGGSLVNTLPLSGRRIFSLMFLTYRKILERIAKDPIGALKCRVRLSAKEKFSLAIGHVVSPLHRSTLHRSTLYQTPLYRTPLYRSSTDDATAGETSGIPSTRGRAQNRFADLFIESEFKSEKSYPLKVAVIGGGLAGIQASIDLARHGAKVTLIEAKSRLGGRVGSYSDSVTGQQIDYCQHVGMKCCTALQRWIKQTSQLESWDETDELHFVAPRSNVRGAKVGISIRPWNVPAPLHLAPLLLKWPKLRLRDRINIAWGIYGLLRTNANSSTLQVDALQWLKTSKQSVVSIQNFWDVILVSALGERPEYVSARAMHKVLIDGFAKTQNASNLLVPNRSLHQLAHDFSLELLDKLDVEVKLSTPVRKVHLCDKGGPPSVAFTEANAFSGDETQEFDAIVVAIPWHQIGSVIQFNKDDSSFLDLIKSSPITGIHTWWNKSWLNQPHAIFIDSFCQWVFPSPHMRQTKNGSLGSDTLASEARNQAANQDSELECAGIGQRSTEQDEHYYQIVVSASRQLKGMTNAEVMATVQREIHERFPSARDSELLRCKVVTDPQSVFSLSPTLDQKRWTPDRYANHRLFLAGDWIQTGWPATMEGALRSGSNAASCLLSRFGLPMIAEY